MNICLAVLVQGCLSAHVCGCAVVVTGETDSKPSEALQPSNNCLLLLWWKEEEEEGESLSIFPSYFCSSLMLRSSWRPRGPVRT